MQDGLYCSAGQNWFSISSDGNVSTCNSMIFRKDCRLGNILDGEVVARKEMGRCPVQKCDQVCDRHWSSKKVMRDGQEVDSEGVNDPAAYNGIEKPCSILWAPSWVCNYNCNYCGLPKDTRKTTAEEWVEAFGRFLDINGFTGGVLHTNGGEPLFYNGIEKVFSFMADRGFHIALTTNLSSDIWTKVVHAAGPEKWRAINCSLHATEPKFNWEIYSGRILALKALGYTVSVNFVGHPCQVMLAPKYAKFCKDNDIHFALIPMIGEFDGFSFKTVDDYPEAMRDVINELCHETLTDTNKFYDGVRAKEKKEAPATDS